MNDYSNYYPNPHRTPTLEAKQLWKALRERGTIAGYTITYVDFRPDRFLLADGKCYAYITQRGISWNPLVIAWEDRDRLTAELLKALDAYPSSWGRAIREGQPVQASYLGSLILVWVKTLHAEEGWAECADTCGEVRNHLLEDLTPLL
jgi:hypothetical protein